MAHHSPEDCGGQKCGPRFAFRFPNGRMRFNMSELPPRTFPEFSLSRLLKTFFEPKPGQRIGILIDLADPKPLEGFAFLKDAALTIQRHARYLDQALKS